MARYKIIACRVLARELAAFASRSSRTFDFHFLEQGLHDTPDLLRTELQSAIDNAGDDYDALLIGYGLCSNGIAGIEARGTPLVVARAHDCITYFLGSKERYRTYFDANPGTYWYTPGWIEAGRQPGKNRYEALLASYAERFGEENAQYLMEMEQGWFKEYAQAAYVDLDSDGENGHYKQYTQECAEWLGWRYEELDGDARLIRRFIEGDWRPEAFLIVAPGQRIVASHDDAVISAEDVN